MALALNFDGLAGPINERVNATGESLHAPHVLDLEVAHALRRYALAGPEAVARAEVGLMYVRRLPVSRYPHVPLLRRVWELRANVTAYDAAYVALAETIGAPLITRDGRLARASGVRARIELFA